MQTRRLALVLAGGLGAGCAPARNCAVDLWWLGEARSVQVVGDFNGWQPETLRPWRRDDATWHLGLELEAGDYQYLFLVDGQETLDPFQPLLAWDPIEQGERSLLRVEDCSQPALEVEEAEATADGALSVSATFLRGVGGSRLDAASAALLDGTPLDVSVSPESGAVDVAANGLAAGKHVVLIDATDRDGREAATLRVPLWVEEEPFSWQGALVYQVVIDRFADEQGALAPVAIGDRHGGTLAGLRQKVEEGWFDALGVGALWISPLYDNPDGH